MRLLASLALAAGFSFGLAPVRAALGGTAERGDNCTPINALAIGVPVPGGADLPLGSIVDASVVLERGWLLRGFVLTSRDGAVWFSPYRTTGVESQGLLGPYGFFLSMPDASHESIRAAFAKLDSSEDALTWWRGDGIPASFTVAPCFAAPLPKGQ